MSDTVRIGTPWELYEIDGVEIHVKREDMSCPYPGPQFSKIRGVALHLSCLPRDTVIGVMDTQHSKAGWGVSYVCHDLGMRCIDFYPVLKADTGLRYNQVMAQKHGAELYPMKAGMSAVLFNQARKILRETYPKSEMLPNGLKLQESVDSTATEVLLTPPELLCGTWVISISSGTLGAAVCKGLSQRKFVGEVILHMGYSRSESQARKYVAEMSGCEAASLVFIDEGFEYKDKVDNKWIPFPCNEYYDAKAFWWLAQHIHELKPPVVFWNIGA